MHLRTLLTRCATALLAAAALSPAASAQQTPGTSPGNKPGAPIKLTPEQQKALEARRKARVYARDLEGLWINAAYVDALRATRMPRQAAAKAGPVVINVKKEGPSYPMLRTNFDKASLLRIIDIQPEPGEGAFRVALAQDDRGPVLASEASYVSFRGRKNESGSFDTLRIAEPLFGKKRLQVFRRAERGLGPLVNELVIAGKYVAGNGDRYEFTEDGEARVPGETFPYEVRLARAGAACEMIESPDEGSGAERKRIGFAWRSGRLQLYTVDASKPGTLRCGAKPFAELQPAP